MPIALIIQSYQCHHIKRQHDLHHPTKAHKLAAGICKIFKLIIFYQAKLRNLLYMHPFLNFLKEKHTVIEQQTQQSAKYWWVFSTDKSLILESFSLHGCVCPFGMCTPFRCKKVTQKVKY
ncbi:hypothetical protein AZ602_07660 [Moraxella sp. RCAD0137]|nr:hypothetical protein AZ602_07660 [Moraxella sp. RCAD0137]